MDSAPVAAGLASGDRYTSAGGGAVLQLLAQRAGEALQRPLRDPLVGALGFVGGGADDDHAAGVADVAHQRREELVQGLQPGRRR